ncbi:bifunctional [glutamate--ammonia ligase]-adenylyl-L-tyrosine phosphorylase/[glutamate--ammonia-ligase] adenylyltransferase [Arthrobacter sp. TPD3018]|uniref:bifunctional [glutamate--ammonia ligase]-adenylyl-L-tyrosine phosphorylase/[glutamate--ammonia-ligase] adenylyltransferase n=1 Tax=Bacteria TaxID=2 RepID=UPI000D5243F5|nr:MULTISPECIES: bifunctional [glutamate--ammonia ligase]-adenylyl-L-tyrosine phosphorylase/[glutamate--ammonia-ligase] adenylyltransferase [Bacteria]PVE58079.1 bifunctional [glutamate--ammonia ligase]-adenylyl-L-tyrosine phosphorylase/[glutamate--ammonia-ligase] adenylyltransferase [Sphingomonas sp. TPD3009]PVE58669.1 bifunctional [glutamate--ammonia ligase]-adenylyl-L-tyrosine phosphorylase/[glutamate--ammonia-ligase] adenylyltransferase [Arthrobacter sp. TPD3018]PVE87928.1 bifunctional [gluta
MPSGLDPDFTDAIQRARSHAPFLSLLLDREPVLAERLAAGQIDLGFTSAEADMPVARQLRLDRRALALSVAIGDLAGALDLAAVTHALTDFADAALDRAIRAAIAERTPGEEPHGFVAIALGKQGSRELNYSSDIDPILLFDPKTLPHRAREEPEEAAVRIAKRVVELLQARDGDGYVLRVDLRLRPSPEATPIALPVEGAIGYYESQALAWERAAFIRARVAAGDKALGSYFLDAIRPFVWRRGLDFGAIGEIRDLSRRIRDHYASGQRFGPGYDLKRGRGGIREAEFFAQIHQLIHGGRDPAMRAPATRDALAALAAAGWIGADEAAALTRSYTLLRTIEHRVQMVDDRQTHTLPTGEALDGVARLHGLADGADLVELLREPVATAGRIYDALDDGQAAGLPHEPQALADWLEAAGFAADGEGASKAAARIAGWRAGRYPALRSPAARAALEAVLPVLMPALAGAPDPAAALLRLDVLFERLSSAINILRLLEARPGLATLLATILSHAAPLADALATRPELIDWLIDASAFEPLGSVDELATELGAGDEGDYQALLDTVRRLVGEKRFAVGAQIVAGAADPLDAAGGYARLAEAAIEVLAAGTVAEFARAHGRVPDSELVILAFGRTGGGALTHASDLDLVYLFTGDFAAESDGAKPLGATLYYNRLAQRITAALSVPTAAGPLYPVDTRLRPSGTQGPLVVSVESFARYQREDAWTWEHMALTRARPVFGSPAARVAVTGVIAEVLEGVRPERDLPAEAATMRADMARHKPPAGPLDAKLLSGGLVDLEFTVHLAQLLHRSGFDPDLRVAIPALTAARVLPDGLLTAHDLLTRLLVTLRLVAPDAQEPPPATQALIARALRLPDWPAVLAAFTATRQEVEAAWRGMTGGCDG